MKNYDELRLVASPQAEGGPPWTIYVHGGPRGIPANLIGVLETVDPQVSKDDLRTLRDGAFWPNAAALKQIGERVWLLNHVSNDVGGPFRASFAVYVREKATTPAIYRDALPPVFATRTISLRGFDADGDLKDAALAAGDGIDPAIRAMLARPEIAFINAHNAAAGCFAARIVRD